MAANPGTVGVDVPRAGAGRRVRSGETLNGAGGNDNRRQLPRRWPPPVSVTGQRNVSRISRL
jgi:hypothetical protein